MPPDTTLTLAFDTSAAHCAAALLAGDAVLVSRSEAMLKGQAERLMPMLGEVLAEGGAGWGDLGRIVVGTGPGNFTGVRISVAAARGLALGLDVPVIGVTMFEALAFGLPGRAAILLDARRERVFLQVFEDGKALAGPRQAGIEELKDEIPAGHMIHGHRAEEIAARLGLTAGAQPVFLPEALALAARDKSGDTRPAPLYLRAADAAPPSDPPPVILDDA